MQATTPDPRLRPPRTRLGRHSRKAPAANDVLPTNEFDASYRTIAYGLFRCDRCKKVTWQECDATWGWMFFCGACGYIGGEEFTRIEKMPAPRPRRPRKPQHRLPPSALQITLSL